MNIVPCLFFLLCASVILVSGATERKAHKNVDEELIVMDLFLAILKDPEFKAMSAIDQHIFLTDVFQIVQHHVDTRNLIQKKRFSKTK